MHRPLLKQIVQWILKAWSDLDKEIIIELSRCCDLSIQDDGSKDKVIEWKPGKPLSSGLERLKAVMIPSLNRTSNMIQIWLLIRTGKKMSEHQKINSIIVCVFYLTLFVSK